MNHTMKLIGIIVALIFTNSCTHLGTNDEHTAMCKELNSQIMFSGSTSNVRAAEISRSETDLSKRTYENNCESLRK